MTLWSAPARPANGTPLRLSWKSSQSLFAHQLSAAPNGRQLGWEGGRPRSDPPGQAAPPADPDPVPDLDGGGLEPAPLVDPGAVELVVVVLDAHVLPNQDMVPQGDLRQGGEVGSLVEDEVGPDPDGPLPLRLQDHSGVEIAPGPEGDPARAQDRGAAVALDPIAELHAGGATVSAVLAGSPASAARPGQLLCGVRP